MAVYIPVRPRWNPRGEVINYVSGGRLCARGWPRGYRDANSVAQRVQRSKMAQVCDVLPYLKGLIAEGYSPVYKRNGRRVGAYHAAVSAALREWFDSTPDGYKTNWAKVRLTDGIRALPAGLAVTRVDRKVRITWHNAAKRRGAKLLFAARLGETQEWVSSVVALERGAVGASLSLPLHWAKGTIRAWMAFVSSEGRLKTQTLHLALPPATARPAPSPSSRGETAEVSVESLARKGQIQVRACPSPRAIKKSSNACKFGLRGHRCLVVKKVAT